MSDSKIRYSRTAIHHRSRTILAKTMFWVGSLAFLAGGLSFAEQEVNRPMTYSLSPAYPVIPIFFPDILDRRETEGLAANVILEIDSHGRVTDFHPEEIADSVITSRLDSAIRETQFVPARFRSSDINCKLPAIVVIRSGVTTPTVFLPVSHDGSVTDLSLYIKSLKMNNIFPAAVRNFPPYFCDYQFDDSLTIYPYILLKLGLDRIGRPIFIESIHSTTPKFSDQIFTAANWASYSPLTIRGEETATSSFLLVSLFPEVDYPTISLDFDSVDSSSIYDRFRVRLISDTVGPLLAPPIPKLSDNLRISILGSNLYAFNHKVVTAGMTIDTSGIAHLVPLYWFSRQFNPIITDALKRIRFYPAIDYSGAPRRFQGTAKFDFTTSGIVRIQPDWLK